MENEIKQINRNMYPVGGIGTIALALKHSNLTVHL